MCLSSVTKVHKKPVMKTFYKVFVNCGAYLRSLRGTTKSYLIGHTYKDRVCKREISSETIRGKQGKTYRRGFHGFITLKAALSYQSKSGWLHEEVYKCEGLVRTEGRQSFNVDMGGGFHTYKAVVADTMTIIERVNP